MRYYFFLLLGWALACQPAAPGPPRPHILWIVSEDNSPLLGCYGDSLAYTPHLDRLAAGGLRYARAYAHAPVCAPSRSSLITGVEATTLGTHHMRCLHPVPEEIRFFPAYLREAGYFTSNRKKKDYNIPDQAGVWDLDDWWHWDEALTGRRPGQPFFMMYNTWMSHEDKMHGDDSRSQAYLRSSLAALGASLDPDSLWEAVAAQVDTVLPPPYHPDTRAMRADWTRYYLRLALMDAEVGLVLDRLAAAGLADSTIVFYFSDHGGVLGRSKRFVYESGLRVPLIVHLPPAWQHLAPAAAGQVVDRLTGFVDLAPTVLALAGVAAPAHMSGRPLLGAEAATGLPYVFGFRGRMDERYDVVRSVTDGAYRYQVNLLPHRPDGQHIDFLWRAASMPAWEAACAAGACDSVQAAFWRPRAAEALYDLATDPHNVTNRMDDPALAAVRDRLRTALRAHLFRSRDVGLVPEGMVLRRVGEAPPYALTHDTAFAYAEVLEMAFTAATTTQAADLRAGLEAAEPAVRFWAATGCARLGTAAAPLRPELQALLQDPFADVRIAASEALWALGERAALQPVWRALLAAPPPARDWQRDPRTYELVHLLNVLAVLGPEAYAPWQAEIAALGDTPAGYVQRLVGEESGTLVR